MADKQIHLSSERGGGRPLNKVNRRDFLYLMGLLTLGPVAYEMGKILVSPVHSGDMMIPDGKTELQIDEKTKLQKAGSKLLAIQAVSSLDHNLNEDTKKPLEDKVGLDDSIASMVKRFEENNGFGVGDVGIVLTAISKASLNQETKDNLLPILDSDPDYVVDLVVDPTKDSDFWRKIIEENNLVLPILNQGTRGKNALLRMGVDANEVEKFEFSREVYDFNGGKPEYTKTGCQLILADKPHDTIVGLGNGQDMAIYSFDKSRTEQEIKWSQFVLEQVGKMYDSAVRWQRFHEDGNHIVEDYYRIDTQRNIPAREFMVLQTWLSDYYRETLQSNKNLTMDQFTIKLYKEMFDCYQNPEKYPLDHVVQKLNLINYSLSNTLSSVDRMRALNNIINWDFVEFGYLVDGSMKPGERVIFNTTKAQTKEPRTYQMIFEESLDEKGRLSPERIIQAVKKYAGNLYLEPIEDRISSDADIKANTERSRYDPDRIRKDILSGRLSLIDHADNFFGETRKFVFSNEGKLLGVIVKEKIAEPIEEIPENVLRVLRAVEGDDWTRGGEYIKKLVLRNIVAEFRKNPESGASSPEMTILESILPGPFDRQNALRTFERKEYAFRRTDLYGIAYLKRLYKAYRDGKPMPEIYQQDNLNSLTTPKDPIDNVWNKLCSKFETAILARDANSDELIKIFFKYVPLGSVALGSEGGIPIYGLEAGAKYLFNKRLKDLNDGEIAILIGMISAPNAYGPKKFVSERLDKNEKIGYWSDNVVDCKERAQTVARLCKEAGGFDIEKMLEEIEKAQFEYYIDPLWKTTFSEKEMNELAGRGILNTLGINLGSGISVIRMNEAIPTMPSMVDLPRYANPEQRNFETLMGDLIKLPDFNLGTEEKSEISDVYKGAIEIISNLDFSNPNWKYEMVYKLANYAKEISYDGEFAFITSKMIDGKVDKNRNPYNKHTVKYDLYNFLYEAENTQVYQCGQLALVLNALYRIKNNTSMPPMLGSGNVDSWVSVLFKDGKPGQIPEHMQTGHEMFLVDIINNPETAIEYINVGDMVVGWAGTVESEEYWIGGRQKAKTGSGHVATVVNKGLDSEGRTWIEVLDSNYNRNGNIRRQIIWGNKNMSDLLFPGTAKNFAVIRKSKIDHGEQISRNNDDFVGNIFAVSLNGNDLALPAMEQKLDVGDGTYITINNPSVAVSVFDQEGFVKSYDKTNVLSTLPVMAGNSIRMFLHAFLIYKGVDTEQKVNVYPGEYTLNGSKVEVRNSTSARMNTDKAAEVSLNMALSGSFDVPHQKVFKEMLEKDPNAWSEFQNFLNIFGIPLVSWDGSVLERPTALATTGRDVYVTNLDRLGYAISSFLNMDKFDNLALIPGIKEACDKTVAVVLDKEKREKLKIGAFPIIQSLGNDVHDQSLSNATVDITAPDGRDLIFIGTRSSFSDTGVVIDPKNGRVLVGVSQSSNKETKLSTLYRRASSLYNFGFIDLLRSII